MDQAQPRRHDEDPADLVGLPYSLRFAVPTVRLVDVDGTHLGLALNWWRAQVGHDQDALDLMRTNIDPVEAFRSAVEALLRLAGWISRNDGSSTDDGGAALLGRLSVDTMLRLPARVLAVALSDALDSGLLDRFIDVEQDPGGHTGGAVLDLPNVGVVAAMSLVEFLGALVELRFGVDRSQQWHAFEQEVLDCYGATSQELL